MRPVASPSSAATGSGNAGCCFQGCRGAGEQGMLNGDKAYYCDRDSAVLSQCPTAGASFWLVSRVPKKLTLDSFYQVFHCVQVGMDFWSSIFCSFSASQSQERRFPAGPLADSDVVTSQGTPWETKLGLRLSGQTSRRPHWSVGSALKHLALWSLSGFLKAPFHPWFQTRSVRTQLFSWR